MFPCNGSPTRGSCGGNERAWLLINMCGLKCEHEMPVKGPKIRENETAFWFVFVLRSSQSLLLELAPPHKKTKGCMNAAHQLMSAEYSMTQRCQRKNQS